MWQSANKSDFPLATTSYLGEFVPIYRTPEAPDINDVYGYQYRVELEYDWLYSPPDIYSKMWDKYHEYEHRPEWVWGKSNTKTSTLENLRMGKPSDRLIVLYKKALAELEPIILPSAPSMRRRRVYNRDNGDPDVEKALAGNEEYLLKRHKVSTEKRIIHLAWQIAHAHVETEEGIARQAAAAVAVTDQLEKFGYRVKLTAYCALDIHSHFRSVEASNIKKRINELVLSFPIKHESHPLDEFKTLCLGLPGVLRHYCFSWISSAMGSDEARLSSGMGVPLYLERFAEAVQRKEKVSAVVMSDAPLTMRTIIQELDND